MNSIKKNFFFNASYQMANMLLPLITAPYISRVLGAQMLGTYTYTYTLAGYFLMFGMLGFTAHGNREIAKVRDNKQMRSRVFTEIFGCQLIASGLILGIYALYIIFMAEAVYRLLLTVQIFHVASAMLDISWLFFGMEDFKATTIRNFVIKIVTVTAMFLFVKSPDDILIYTAIMAGGVLFSQMVLWGGVPAIVEIKKEYWNIKFTHFKSSFILFIPHIAVSVYTTMDKIMLGRMSGMEELAFYENAYKIISVPIGLITAFEAIMLPRMVNLTARGEQQSVNKLLEESFSVVGMACTPMMVGIAVIAQRLTLLLFGVEYEMSGRIMEILAITIPLISWAGIIRKEILIPRGLDRIYIISVVVGAVTNLILNLNLIPVLGEVGAACGTVAAEASVCGYQIAKTRLLQPYGRYLKDSLPFLFAAIIMGTSICLLNRFIPGTALGLILLVLFGVVFYAGMFFVILKIMRRSLKDSILLK